MKRLLLYLLLNYIILNILVLNAQELPDSLLLGNDLINQAIQLHDDGKFEQALTKYMEVSDCDPSYPLACYEMALTYRSLDEDSLALNKCYEALALNYDTYSVYVMIGSIYDDYNLHEKSLQILKEAAKQWPYNQNVMYNLGITQINAGLYTEAKKSLQQSILINPFHGSSHQALGDVNYRMGRAAQAYLAYSFRVLLNPTITNINTFQNVLTGRSDKNYKPYLYSYPADYDHAHWDRLKHLVQSELAFHEDFPYDYDVSYAITRQTYMLFSEVKFIPDDQSLYNQLYARFFQELMQDIGFDTYLNYMLKNTNNEEVKKWRETNEDKIDEFIKWAQNKIVTGRKYTFSYKLEQEDKRLYHYEDGELWGIGSLVRKSDPVKEGQWLLVNNYGQITEKSVYKNGKQQGERFIYWDGEKIKQHLFYKDGEFNGDCITYHENGNISGKYPIKNGKRNGIQYTFSPSGEELERIHYKEDTLDGPYMYTDQESGFRQDLSYLNGKIEGDFKETWLNGKTKTMSTYHADKAEGKYQTFYKNGKLSTVSFYDNDIKTDTLKEYYANGKLQHLAYLDDSSRVIGTNLFYNRQGLLIAKEEGYSKGVLNGSRIEYRETDGSKLVEYSYQNDSLIGITCYNPNGNIIYKSEIKDQVLPYKSFYNDGTLCEEGIIKNDKRDGLWKKYNPLGGLMEEQQYMNGMVHGSVNTYFSNGQIKMSYACDSNKIEGPFIEYFKSGSVSRTGWFTKGKWQGLWKSYFINGVLKNESFYNDDIIQGKRKVYSAQGKLLNEEYYDQLGQTQRMVFYNENGDKSVDFDLSSGSGHLEEYFSNGQKRRDWHFKDFKKQGKQLIYYPNGQLASEESFIAGFEDGVSLSWTHDGQPYYTYPLTMGLPDGKVTFYKNATVSTEKQYELGMLQGEKTRYYTNGIISSKTEYKDDELHGYSLYYNPEGQLLYRNKYVNGYLKSISYEKQGGDFSNEIILGQDSKQILCYYKNNNKSASFTIINGNYEGRVHWYYPSGKLYRDCNYEKGLLKGLEKWYYQTGQVKEEVNWIDGEQEGQYKLYYENGNTQEEGTYTCGQKEGEWRYYSINGKLLKKIHFYGDEIYDIEEL